MLLTSVSFMNAFIYYACMKLMKEHTWSMAESEEELESFLIKVKEESEKVG